MTNPSAPTSKPAGPSASDIKNDPGLAPENHVRGEALHKASTDRQANDIIENSGAKDLWVINVHSVLVRADDEAAAESKFLGALGVAFDAREVTVRQAKPSDV
jgi:hypothetical protein